jgi:thiol-disulfide isomerase/thioredoxin
MATDADKVTEAQYYDSRAAAYQKYFASGLTFEQLVDTAKPPHQARWRELDARVRLTDEQRALVSGFSRVMNVLVLAASWCPDCMWQLPTLRRVDELSPLVTVRLIDRDQHPELTDSLRMAGAAKIPVAVFLSEDFFECSRYGERTLTTYRAVSRLFLGAACPIGEIFNDDQLAATSAEWMNEIERVQLMLRLSPQLRERYQD